MKDERWISAMEEEVSTLEETGTWNIVDMPKCKKSIGCKWVYKVKYNSDGSVEICKARLVAKGYNQTYWIDYMNTFSLVAKMVTTTIIWALASV